MTSREHDHKKKASRKSASPPAQQGWTESQPDKAFSGGRKGAKANNLLEPLSAAMEYCLHQEGCYDSEQGLRERRKTLTTLNILVKQWMQSVCLARNLSTRNVELMGGRIITYGSYMLGITNKGADIDALCIAPKSITREEYFTSFFKYLGFQDEISQLRKIEEAFVPVIKMRFNNIDIDMTFARLNLDRLPEEDEFLRDIALTGLDPRCIRSLNGFRSTQELLRLVPNANTFRVTLRAIKLWAKKQGVYSNTLGYLGGFSWATLVAKTCMDHPSKTPAETVHQFFLMFSQWKWPNCVSLVNMEETAAAAASTMGGTTAFVSWNPDKYIHDKLHVMPIITPTYPHLNSTFNVTLKTLQLIQQKMTEASKITTNVLAGINSWDRLFEMKHIFDEVENFLLLMASAKANESVQWFGLIESKIRHFIANLENEYGFKSARIWPKPWRNCNPREPGDLVTWIWFVGVEVEQKVDISQLENMRYAQSFFESLATHSSKFKTADMSFKVHSISRSELMARSLGSRPPSPSSVTSQCQHRRGKTGRLTGGTKKRGKRPDVSDTSSQLGQQASVSAPILPYYGYIEATQVPPHQGSGLCHSSEDYQISLPGYYTCYPQNGVLHQPHAHSHISANSSPNIPNSRQQTMFPFPPQPYVKGLAASEGASTCYSSSGIRPLNNGISNVLRELKATNDKKDVAHGGLDYMLLRLQILQDLNRAHDIRPCR